MAHRQIRFVLSKATDGDWFPYRNLETCKTPLPAADQPLVTVRRCQHPQFLVSQKLRSISRSSLSEPPRIRNGKLGLGELCSLRQLPLARASSTSMRAIASSFAWGQARKMCWALAE
jgi:hypothetical protein